MAKLPQRLLGHPKGGALAVVGHVDRAWGSSFIWEGAQQVATFESGLTRLLEGARLGVVVEDFNNRYAELSTELTTRVEAIKFREIVPPEELAGLWTANNDARSYVVLGDPAVRIPVAGNPTTSAARPAIESIVLSTAVAPAADVKYPTHETPSPASAASPELQQSLRQALEQMEAAVALLKAAPDLQQALHQALEQMEATTALLKAALDNK